MGEFESPPSPPGSPASPDTKSAWGGRFVAQVAPPAAGGLHAAGGPTVPIPYLPDLELDTGGPSRVDEVVAEHKKRMRSGVEEQWRLLGAVKRVVGEVAV